MDSRTPDQIRAEIAAERARLTEAVDALKTGGKQTGKTAGVAVGALAGVVTLGKLARGLRRRSRKK